MKDGLVLSAEQGSEANPFRQRGNKVRPDSLGTVYACFKQQTAESQDIQGHVKYFLIVLERNSMAPVSDHCRINCKPWFLLVE